jgi:uncharacterized protein YjiS (DUF1127 family)
MWLEFGRCPNHLSLRKGIIMFEVMTSRFSAWKRYAQTRSALESLSFRELEDMGIARGDIPALARAAVRR